MTWAKNVPGSVNDLSLLQGQGLLQDLGCPVSTVHGYFYISSLNNWSNRMCRNLIMTLMQGLSKDCNCTLLLTHYKQKMPHNIFRRLKSSENSILVHEMFRTYYSIGRKYFESIIFAANSIQVHSICRKWYLKSIVSAGNGILSP